MKKLLIFCVAVGFVFTLSNSAIAADLNVPVPYATIQDAIDAAANGDTIIVSEGTYQECLTIEDLSDVKLMADGNVTIEPKAGGCGTRAPTILIRNSSFTVDGFSVDGDYNGIVARGDVDVSIENNSVYDYVKNGITVIGEEDNFGYARIIGNIVTGRGNLPYGDWAQNGIQLQWCDGMIKDNTVSANWYIGGYWTATNILIYAFNADFDPVNADVQILKNNLTAGQTGIYVYASGVSLTKNIIAGALYGPYPADWPPTDPPTSYYDHGSWGITLYGTNNKAVNNIVGPYDVGVESYLFNNKIINNKFVGCEEPFLDAGESTKIHANGFSDYSE